MTVSRYLALGAGVFLILVNLTLGCGAYAADTERTVKDLQMPGEDLRTSLRMIATEYEVNVLFADSVVEGKVSQAINGSFTAEEALQAALKGSGLVLESDNSGNFVVRAVGNASEAQTSTAISSSDQPRGRLEEVIVTGTKIPRSLQNTTTSVSVWDIDTIDKQNFVTLADILNQTANVSTSNNESIITIRGLRNEGAGSFENTSDVSSVYVDGVFLPSALFGSGALNLWDIETAEIFRGPQSTVQGRNALAGAVVLNTKDPDNEFSLDAQVQIADYDTQRLSAAATLPISDTFSLRLAIDDTSSDGFISNPTLDTDASDRSEARTIRAKARWQPTDRLDIKLNYTNVDSYRGDGRIVANRFPSERVTLENIQSRSEVEADITSLNIDYVLNDVWTLTSVTARNESPFSLFLDTTNDETGGDSVLDATGEDEILSQELRASFQTERTRGVLGAYLYDQTSENTSVSQVILTTDDVLPDATTFASIFFGTGSPTPPQIDQGASIRNRVVTTLPSFPLVFNRASDLQIQNWALFGEIDIDLSDRWSATLGLRYDSESVDQNVFDANVIPPIETGDGLVDAVVTVLAGQFSEALAVENVDNDYGVWLPKAVLSYAWNDSVSTSFSYQRGYRAGGLSVNLFRAALAPQGSSQNDLESLGIVNRYGEEFTDNYELALRSRLLEDQLQLNANLYFIDYKDQQIRVQLSPNPLDELTANVGASEMYGFEVDAAFTVNERLSLGANLGLANTEFTDGVGVLDGVVSGGLDLTGLEFSFAPRWTAGAFARYQWLSGWFVNGRLRYTDESFAEPDNDPLQVNDSFTVCDFIAGYEASSWRAELFVNNAFDEDYLTLNNGPDNAASSVAGAPRLYGGRLVVHL
ncbi:MAG: TonB-dependent receptor [Pseudomonadota bacterium]